MESSVTSILKDLSSSLPPYMQAYWLEIAIGVIVGTFIAILFLGWQCLCRRSKGRNVCLLGLSNSGKTLLFLQLTTEKYGPTQNSIAENVFKNYEPASKENKKPVILVDVPGNERVRDRIFSSYKDSLRGVVVVIDSLNFPSERHDLAELLYDLFADPSLHKARAPILLACNKQDIALAKTVNSIREDLEEEMKQLQVSRRAKLLSLEGGSKSKKPVEFVKKGKDFSFADLPSWMSVNFVAVSARGRDIEVDADVGGVADVRAVRDWIANLCQ